MVQYVILFYFVLAKSDCYVY